MCSFRSSFLVRLISRLASHLLFSSAFSRWRGVIHYLQLRDVCLQLLAIGDCRTITVFFSACATFSALFSLYCAVDASTGDCQSRLYSFPALVRDTSPAGKRKRRFEPSLLKSYPFFSLPFSVQNTMQNFPPVFQPLQKTHHLVTCLTAVDIS